MPWPAFLDAMKPHRVKMWICLRQPDRPFLKLGFAPGAWYYIDEVKEVDHRMSMF